MSLMVSLIQKKDISIPIDTHLLEQQVPEPHNDLFGFESCRKTLWGHKIIHELGCELIYSLKETDIYVFDEELEKLEREFLILLEHFDIIKQHTGYDRDFVEFRARNALEMIKVALRERNTVGVTIG
ncbi:hypothetical protein JI735_34740 (plasmid) [Paenibacillus sonchi]|uniref:Uncharacterized protein n=1 Tax=Paenibacillus sonchi TaxID=373687 RepID=A0A974SG18_9BACL|nr:hypothetical protein [Paenibacillus sonchi]QQZ64587.1 hypothetical protein JI735_34740 [Paenibacillus sonchi]